MLVAQIKRLPHRGGEVTQNDIKTLFGRQRMEPDAVYRTVGDDYSESGTSVVIFIIVPYFDFWFFIVHIFSVPCEH